MPVANRLLVMLFSRPDYAWSCRLESNNLNNFDTYDNTFESQLKSRNSEHNKRFHKIQIPKLLMSFDDGKIQSSVLGHGKSDSPLSRSNYIKLRKLKN